MTRPIALAAISTALLFPATVARAADAAVDVQDNAFAPAEVTVSVGDTVTWTQTGSNPHSVTADDGSFDSHPNCSFATGECMQQGQTYEQVFNTPGRVQYYCRIHGGPLGTGMSGVIVVQQ